MGDEARAPTEDAKPPATLSLVIPAFNEEARLPALLAKLDSEAAAATTAAGMRFVETVIVDDGSTDRTAQMLREAAASDPRLEPVVEFASNRGKGAAFAAGVARARGDYVLLADVDLSTSLGELSKLGAAIAAGADVAIGSRAVPGAEVERGPLLRSITGATFNLAVRLLTGLGVRDTQNGFKLFPTEPLKRYAAELTCSGFAFDVELLMRADRDGLEIVEVPIRYVHDERSRVKVASASAAMLREIAALSWRLRLGRGAAAAGRSGAAVRRS